SRNFAGRMRRPLSSSFGSYVPRNMSPPTSPSAPDSPTLLHFPPLSTEMGLSFPYFSLKLHVKEGGARWRNVSRETAGREGAALGSRHARIPAFAPTQSGASPS